MASTGDPPNPSSTQAQAQQGDPQQQQLVLDAPPPAVREDYVQNAVKFLSHPKVRGSPVLYRRSFLDKKGLTKDEIDEAFRRVPDPQPTTATPPSTTTSHHHQASHQNQSTLVQPHAPVQSATALAPAGSIIVATSPKFSWYRAFVAAGLLLGFGVSTALFVKKLLLPRLKSWIRKVVAEGDENDGAQLKSKIDDETAEAVKASASAVSSIAKTNQQLLASKDEEKKILVTLTQALDSQAKELKSLCDSLNHSRESINITREDRFSQYRALEEHTPSAARNGPANAPWRASQQTNMYGVPNSDFVSGRPSFAPQHNEIAPGSFTRSYVEQTPAAQRGDRSSGSKPWEMQQYSQQQRIGYGSNSQLSDDGSSYPEVQDSHSYHQNGKAPDFQVEAEDARPSPSVYISGVEERPAPPQRRWVPPQPPAVVMPEAATAIRQPNKSLAKQPSSEEASEAHANGAPAGSSSLEEAVNGSDAVRSEIEEQSSEAV
ncbi:peroxisomal membrane protein PEX14-like isoform X1 [Oryza brachyantha]|uniref:peroxisomal membrane protein PEX14-like isoform X1 n=1 Tax=Oryza brachyantha TaxID=4533 RepID=UPI00077664D2|nr:peroxisomal membrane protein PEX14-like isoform X1 [Oryza brachyantha]